MSKIARGELTTAGFEIAARYNAIVKRTIEVLNELEKAGVFSRYAIGGAMGAIFYTEPFLTFDLDVLESPAVALQPLRVVLPSTHGGLLTLAPIYDALRARGYADENKCVTIEGVPVQFLPAYNALIEEALKEAQDTTYENVPARILRSEYLVAIALQTGRSKDRDRVRILREQAKLDMSLLAAILKRHELEEKWKRWTE
ncbi:MAG: hypothetical protein M3480_02660 [Verrucomicrobiota bacterium]|nr:hypothetical protein [Verrucomicrobiota bacterium]